jgi:WD40 repeat protein
VGGIAFSNDNPTSMFATVGENGGPTFVKIWNANTGALLETIQDSCGNHTPPCGASGTTVAFSPDNSKILVGGYGGVNQYNVSDGSLVNNLVPAPAGSGQRLATYSPDGSEVAVPGVSLYSSNGPLLATASLQATAGGYVSFLNIPVVFSPNGSSLFAAFYDEYGEICPTYGVQQLSTAGASLSPVAKPAIASFCNALLGSYGINAIAISADGTLLAVGTNTDGRVLVFSTSSGSLLATLLGNTGQIESIAFSPDGQTLAATDSNDNISIWSASAGNFGTLLETYNQETGNEPLSATRGYGYPLGDVAYSPDGTKIGYARFDSVAVVAANPYPPTYSTTTAGSPATVTFSPTSQSVMLTATVTSTGGTVNSGTVTFTVVGVGISVTSGTVSSGAASALFTVPGGTLATTYTIQAAYSGATGFTSSSDTTKTLTIQQATPVLTWGVPAAIIYGGALSAVQLDATAAIPGSFVYTPPAGTVLPVGANQPLSVAFTPADSTDYTAASTSTTITVNPASPPSSPANLVVTHVLTRVVIVSESGGSNDVAVHLTIANTGGTAASYVELSSVKLGSYPATPLCSAAVCPRLPLDFGTIGAGASGQVTVTVPGVVGASGAASSLVVSGTYSGGTFNSSSRITLP